MPFNGSGVYTAPAADFPVVTQTVISSTHFNNTVNDIATALSTCLTKDGQQVATANINFGGFRATNVGITGIAGSVGTPAINVSDTGTGLYRSAAGELAVTVAGSQVARFASTGLIVTGAASISTTLTASTSVVTPLVGTSSAADLAFQTTGNNQWVIRNASGALTPNSDLGVNLGSTSFRVNAVFTPTIDSGTTGSLSLRTNNGSTQAFIQHVASAVNTLQIMGSPTGTPTSIGIGGEAGTSLNFFVKGTGFYSFTTGATTDAGAAGVSQFQVLHTASATSNARITGAAAAGTVGATLSISDSRSLAITPSVVIAGASVSVGTTPASAGDLRVPNNGSLQCRNGTNSGDIALVAGQTVNTVGDVIVVGSGSSGILGIARSAAGVPTTSDIANGRWALWRDTSGATTKLYYNNSGALQSVALA